MERATLKKKREETATSPLQVSSSHETDRQTGADVCLSQHRDRQLRKRWRRVHERVMSQGGSLFTVSSSCSSLLQLLLQSPGTKNAGSSRPSKGKEDPPPPTIKSPSKRSSSTATKSPKQSSSTSKGPPSPPAATKTSPVGKRKEKPPLAPSIKKEEVEVEEGEVQGGGGGGGEAAPAVTTTKSGRLSIPRLDYWRSEHASTSVDGQLVIHTGGFYDYYRCYDN